MDALHGGYSASGASFGGLCIFNGPVRENTVQERRVIKHIVEMEFNVQSLKAFFGLVRHGVGRLLYERMRMAYQIYRALVRFPAVTLEEGFRLGILCLIRRMMVSAALTLVL